MKSGLVKHKGKTCVFKLRDFTLEIEEIENRDKIYVDEIDELFNKRISSEDVPSIIKGIDFDKGYEYLFFIKGLQNLSIKSQIFTLSSYIVFNFITHKNEEVEFDSISINAEELDWFYNVRTAYNYSINPESGETTVNIVPFEEIDKQFHFNIDDREIYARLNIIRNISNMSTNPIRLKTDLSFYYGEVMDYNNLYKWIDTIINFFEFITYRKNSNINNIYLKRRIQDTDKFRIVGKVFVDRDISNHKEDDTTIREQMIDITIIEEYFGEVLKRLFNGNIYLTHIPEDSKDRRKITPSRFVLITAGFEWQFKKNYNISSHENEDNYEMERQEIVDFLDNRIKETSGKKKKFFKSYIKIIKNTDLNLSNKIQWALKEFNDVLDIFIKDLYTGINGIDEVNYTKLADRMQNQRNNYAHGNIDKDVDPLVQLDVIVLEWLYYAMVLRDIGISDFNIKKAINKLFSRNFALEE